MALSGEVAFLMSDTTEGERIVANLYYLAQRDGSIAEVYFHRNGFPLFNSILITSERPFSWVAAYVINMLQVKEQMTQ